VEPRHRQVGRWIAIPERSLPETRVLGNLDGRRFHSGIQSENTQRGCRRQRKVAGGESELTGQGPEVLPGESPAELDIITGGPDGRGGRHQHAQEDKRGQRWRQFVDDHPHRASSMPAEQTLTPYPNTFRSQLAAVKLTN